VTAAARWLPNNATTRLAHRSHARRTLAGVIVVHVGDRAGAGSIPYSRFPKMALFTKKSVAELRLEAEKGTLRRSLGRLNLTALGVGSIIGTGIFVLTGTAAAQNAGPSLVLWSGVLRGAAVMFFAYIGFDAVSTAAQESKNPQRDLPFGILVSLALCTVLYIAVAIVLIGIVPMRSSTSRIQSPLESKRRG